MKERDRVSFTYLVEEERNWIGDRTSSLSLPPPVSFPAKATGAKYVLELIRLIFPRAKSLEYVRIGELFLDILDRILIYYIWHTLCETRPPPDQLTASRL